ncbi:cupin domain-containing protein [Rubritalea sp.]|uniref:cupin domain-containing protein n=1 Tax=Rubritalea sp. TaxID=2109375 RepID=UPI003EF24875
MFIEDKDIIAEPADMGLNEFFSHHLLKQGAPSKDILLIRGTIKPGFGHDFHYHQDREEFLYILSGSIEQWIGEEKRFLGPGEVVYIPAGVIHGSYNVGDEDAQLLAIFNNKDADAEIATDVSNQEPWASIRE